MLDSCAAGYTRRQTNHHWVIRYQGKVYPGFPLGEHGKRTNVNIQIGHVRHVARLFEIDDCAKRHLPQLA